MNAIQTNGLTKYYGRNRGIEDVCLTVAEGDFFGFIGPNGADILHDKALKGGVFGGRRGIERCGVDCGFYSV